MPLGRDTSDDLLTVAAHACVVDGDAAHVWDTARAMPPYEGDDVTRSERRRWQLTELIYTELYSTGGVPLTSPPSLRLDDGARWIDGLERRCGYGWSDGWVIASVDGANGVRAERNGAVRFVRHGDYVVEAEYDTISAGLPIRVLSRTVRPMSEVFWVLSTRELLPGPHESTLVRAYISMRGDGPKTQLAFALLEDFDRYAVAARIKVLIDSGGTERCDSVVVYFPSEHGRLVGALVHRAVGPFASDLGDRVPLFCDHAAPGIGLADDPGDGMSFGLQVSLLSATGLIAAWESTPNRLGDRIAQIRLAFENAGVDPARAYLRVGHRERVSWP